MPWTLFGQLVALILILWIAVSVTISHLIDERRKDAYHRKENGL